MEVLEDNKKRKVVEFTYQSFISFARSRKKSATAKRLKLNSSREKSGYRTKFTGTKNIEEAFNLAEHGWDSGIEKLQLEEGLLVGGNGMDVQESVCGSMVNIGNYIQGLPNNMYEFSEKREYNLESLTIYVPLTYSGATNQKKALNFTKSIINLVNEYQSKNNIRIIGVFYCSLSNKRFIHRVLIKDFDERFVINNVAFAFHPSFFRRLQFSVLESEDLIDSGYGYIKNYSEIKKYIKEIRKGKSIAVPTLNYLDSGIFTKNDTTEI